MDNLTLNTLGGIIGALIAARSKFLPELGEFERIVVRAAELH